MLAVIAAFIVVAVLRFLFFLMLLGSAAAFGDKGVTIPKSGGVLDIDLSAFTLGEQTQSEPAPTFSLSGMGAMMPTLGVRDAVLALQEAANDPAIKFVYLRADGASGGIAQLEEFREHTKLPFVIKSFSFNKPASSPTKAFACALLNWKCNAEFSLEASSLTV